MNAQMKMLVHIKRNCGQLLHTKGEKESWKRHMGPAFLFGAGGPNRGAKLLRYSSLCSSTRKMNPLTERDA